MAPTSFLAHLNTSGDKYAIVMAGQSSPWQELLRSQIADPKFCSIFGGLLRASDDLLAPVAPQLVAVSAGTLSGQRLAQDPNGVNAALSVPGITVTQYLQYRALINAGLDVAANQPIAVLGHSQGVLGVGMVQSDNPAEVLAIARLIGAATSRASRGLSTPPMLAIEGLGTAEVRAIIDGTGVELALVNGRTRHVVSGKPADLELVKRTLNADVNAEYLEVAAPFHHSMLSDGVEQVITWAKACDLPLELAETYARTVMTDHIDWPAELRGVAGAQWLIELGPGRSRLTEDNVEGTGVGIARAHTLDEIDRLATVGNLPPRTTDWSRYAPRAVQLPTGEAVETAFSRLTGNSPIILAGMTPTTVDPEIVSAAANAGFWAELAGGGQVTAEVFARNLADLKEQLDPGRTAKFNAMFMDRYLWNLQFGAQRIVGKARESGAPIDGVVVSAGIPELDEAPQLIEELQSQGFRYVCFKPGTKSQIRQCLAIAETVPTTVILHVEDGHAGGHHSWESLDDLLLNTYAEIRRHDNVILCVGGGIGTPDRAADFISGEWSLDHNMQKMPVDGVLIGTAAMTAKEARTTEPVKDLLVATPGVAGNEWEGGGVRSGLSHLRADMYEIDNDAAACARLIAEVEGDMDRINARRDEIIEALNKTAKPYFGDLPEMTYAQVVRRFAELSYPWVDPSWSQRYWELLQRVEARLSPADHGPVTTLFPFVDDADQAFSAADKLIAAYPHAEKLTLTSLDAAWFVSLCRKYPKPMGFVPVLDDDLLRAWGQDCLWQSQDDRYEASAVRVIPGPVSVRGITTKNEPIGTILNRFEQAVRARLGKSTPVVSRLASATTAEELIQAAPFISWTGHVMDNPAHNLSCYDLVIDNPEDIGRATVSATLTVKLDTYWDGSQADAHAVRELVVPLLLPTSVVDGGLPIVDEDRLPESMYALLAGTAGVGNTSVTHDEITAMPAMAPSERSPYGEAHYAFHLTDNLGPDHTAVTGADMATARIVPDALLGPCWPAIYAALGSARVNDYPVIEGLLNAVHLDHTVSFSRPVDGLDNARVDVTSWAESVQESSSGRVVQVNLELRIEGELLGTFTERFAIRGRAFGTDKPSEPAFAGGVEKMEDTPRSTLLREVVTAPSNMTPFAWVSGDFNPIHTSCAAATVAGLEAPLVHGMWLSATAQHAVAKSGYRITGWTYRMFNMVALDAEVEIKVERIGRRPQGGLVLEVTCSIDGELVSQATVATDIPRSAYVYPGQGIQSKGMGLNERANSRATAEVWERADAHTRSALGFSILTVVRDNPTELTAGQTVYRHPEGVLNLTQFTQVALATLAFAQTARLREAGGVADGAFFAGHSLGEYNALSAYAQVIDLETVLELVFHRGSTMHNLVERDPQGRSNYRMGALRPNQFGVTTDEAVKQYVAEVSRGTGEFLEIVNYNLAGQQYAVAGTIAGIEALELDANERAAAAGGKGAFMLVPGIDVPFHSQVLRGGVGEFRDRLTELLPQHIEISALEGHYVPNLVAIPFELTREFAEAILQVVPSEPIKEALENWDVQDRNELGRMLLIELLCWQFASPVRWIETQKLLLRDKQVEDYIEVGLGAAPTLANLASKTLALPQFADLTVRVLNVQRDEKLVYQQDVHTIEDPREEAPTEPATNKPAANKPVANKAAANQAVANQGNSAPSTNRPAANQAATGQAPATPTAPAASPGLAAEAGQTSPSAATAQAASATPTAPAAPAAEIPTLPYRASDAIKTLLAYSNKVRADQIGDADTTGTLTNGVSSRLNQLLMDMSAELGLSSVEGAAEADVATLSGTVDKAAFNYTAFGPILGEAVKDRVRKLFGASGAKQSFIGEYLTTEWGLGDGWAAHTTAAIVLGTRDGASARGGDLATLPTEVASMSAVKDLIDEAVTQVGSAHGISVAKPASSGADGVAVDSAALDAFSEQITGSLASTARHLLDSLGLGSTESTDFAEDNDAATVMEAVEAELGSTWPQLVSPCFDSRRAILFDDRWATAREDVARLGTGEALDVNLNSFIGTGQAVADQALWWAERSEASELLRSIASAATSTDPGEYHSQVAVVTGMTPDSIAGGVVARLLEGGATVVATASRITSSRLSFVKNLYRRHARAGAALWLVPANLASYRDVDALVEWIGNEQTETVGSDVKVTKPALTPGLYFPFAAPPVMGSVEDAGAAAENQARLLLWSVERSMTALGRIGVESNVAHRLHVVLPGSPNRGTFGGDGAYGETKAAFDAIVNKWKVEPWAERITIAHPRIGWVAGTGLMGGNDPLVEAAQRAGVRVFTPAEISEELLALCTSQARHQARKCPIEADLTGGLSEINIGELEEVASDKKVKEEEQPATVDALPTPYQPTQPAGTWGTTTATLDETVVIVGLGEVSPWGSGRTRFEAEYGMQSDGTVDLTAAGVLELAWMTGLLTWKDTPKAGWYDQEDQIVDEAEIFDRYRDEVVARSGVRTFVTDSAIANDGEGPHSPKSVEMFLDRDVTFSVDSKADAKAFVEADPQFTRAVDVDGEWQVTRLAGARSRVPRRATLARRVGGQFPTDFDPTRWGVPQDMVESLDRMAVWNLVATVDAFLSAGFSPSELLEAVHPAEVAMTQGTGFGGMTSMRKLFVDRFLGEDIPSDILQETLPNVVAAHTMQSFVGGYGSMVHPVGACATAAVSIEEGMDKIRCGKADFVVAGAVDDISVESISGFANMNATANSEAMAAKGISERFYSRAGDRRRGGFVEAQGGGTVLLARGAVAARMGLPVYGVVGFAQSYADGIHTSIPAPGIGALASVRKSSQIRGNLEALGVTADDIAVVSKHDTSTNANDPNEANLHTRMAKALGRTPGNPMFVVSQKTLTGHAKGGAAVFQVAGITDMFRTGRIPGNRALDCLDPAMEDSLYLVWPRSPLQLDRTIKAGILTSLGFGHVSAVVVLVHPAAFRAVVATELGEDSAAQWQERATQRLRQGVRRREAGMLGHAPLFERPAGRIYAADDEEAAMLLGDES
ncbi:fatty acid synthase subunit beta domain-containing protein [Corynebacterium auriscanis]|uniref:fatty acid synthase subunit beta domain-containing protein n=1 Tax=Corynebacterium auriscanis TaxID=99807 RepID=UPI003CE83EA2